ncbi:transcription factor TGAL3-like [Dendrobium catenatum]|uniref:transcription factor TGAL3-like n=1 Tax=Dendrobium catenatum TaxID=906689 RepID=UPI00109F346C|nr:transcription factor TGAL3-like [Dendrobium catenatum]
MTPRQNHQSPQQEAEIEDLLQEIARLKLRLSRIERRSLQTDDEDDEGISIDHISSTPPSVEFSLEEIEDPLPKSLPLTVYDEPIYDVYDDDIFTGVLDLDQLIYDNDASKVDTPREIVIPIKTTIMLTVIDSDIGNIGLSAGVNGVLAFDREYARWLDQHQNQISNLRSAFNSQADDEELRLLIDGLMSHYDVFFKLKSICTRSDIFHMLSGLWTTPAESCFMWPGGFRSSELLKQSLQRAEVAVSQGMEAIQLSLRDTLSHVSDNIANYMNQMAISMSKLGTLENFLWQADLLRQHTLQQMHRILSIRHAARSLLDGAANTGWNYPDLFSQPNPPPYGGQPDLFLRAQSFLLPR